MADRSSGPRVGRRPLGRASDFADDAAAVDAAAAEHHGERRPPVVAAGVLVDPRRAAELAGHDHQRRVEQAAVGQVAEQRRHAGVERRQQLVLQRVRSCCRACPSCCGRSSRSARPPRPAAGPSGTTGRAMCGRTRRAASRARRAMSNACLAAGEVIRSNALLAEDAHGRGPCGWPAPRPTCWKRSTCVEQLAAVVEAVGGERRRRHEVGHGEVRARWGRRR